MKRRFCVLCILGMLLLCLVSCGGVHLEADLAVCGVYSVPGMFCADLKGGSVSSNIIDEDLEGRILFDYSTFNIITGKKESAFVICQFRDGDYVYFYEDVCYCLEKNDQQAIESFMTENDWGQPLDFNKMSRRKVKVTIDLFINTETQLEYKKQASMDFYKKIGSDYGNPDQEFVDLVLDELMIYRDGGTTDGKHD